MTRADEIHLIIKKVKKDIVEYAEELSKSVTSKYLLLLEDKLRELREYMEEEKSLKEE